MVASLSSHHSAETPESSDSFSNFDLAILPVRRHSETVLGPFDPVAATKRARSIPGRDSSQSSL